MLRDYGKVYHAIFTDEKSAKWPDLVFRIAVYLLAGPHANLIGCFRLPAAYVAEDLSNRSATVPQRLRKGSANRSLTVAERLAHGCGTVADGLQYLSDTGFIRYCAHTKWVWIVNFLRYNQFENPNTARSALKFAEAVPVNCEFYPQFIESIIVNGRWTFSKDDLSETVAERLGQPLPNPSETVAERLGHGSARGRTRRPEPEPEPLPEPEPEPEHEPSICVEFAASNDSAHFIDLPLVGGANEAHITEQQISGWEASYPGVDVRQQLRHMREWLTHNPTKRKTPRGIGRFIVNWLAREQDRGKLGAARQHGKAVDNSAAAAEAIRIRKERQQRDSENAT